ncbi:NAD(P)H-dependent oxidoreductase [Bacillus shivajii]|uniref:NAD(P)H-dependent oxidoreductase n=1 Tax=Bacillus shivajii TaxID=1983719 RepID=UPI001CFAFC76|nr:NAD(P)H-dependent oxidoreductase [Bacillus shivajii]UCZ52035.1 NAD(P)H-dependent oxidoreductase [Bacillus shivajii]
MNHLVIYMHPSRDSFNGAILSEYTKALQKAGKQVNVRNLTEQSFPPVLLKSEYEESLQGINKKDVVDEQKFIIDADIITFLFPLWWGGFPAIGKGYVDRVFSYDFAYRLINEKPIPLLTGKKVRMIFTSGTPEGELHQSGLYDQMVNLIDKSIFKFCGLELDGILHFGNVIEATNKERSKMLKEVVEFVNTKG